MEVYLAIIGTGLFVSIPLLAVCLKQLSTSLNEWNSEAKQVSNRLAEIIEKWNELTSSDDEADWWKDN